MARPYIFYTLWIFSLYITLAQSGEVIDCENKGARTTTMKLKANLLCNYDKSVRPVLHDSNRTTVKLMVAPRIIVFHEDSSVLNIKIWINLNWNDSLLRWDKLEYDNISTIGLDSNEVWVPDLHVYNSMEDTTLEQLYGPIILESEGKVNAFMTPVFSTHCIPDWKNWPYDTHVCIMVLGSKRFYGSTVDFQFVGNNLGLTMSYFLKSKDWQIVDHKAYRNVTSLTPYLTDPTEEIFLVTLDYTFTLKRHASVYVACFIIPGFIMVFLSLGILWLPSDRMERLAVLCTLVIFQSIFLSDLCWRIPTNGDTTPYIVCFFRDCTLLTGLLFVETIITRSMLSWSTKPAYLDSTFRLVASNRVLQFIFVHDIDPKRSAMMMEAGNDEGATLVPADENVQNWQTFVNIVNRAFFIILVPVYLLLSVSLLPMNFSFSATSI